MQFSGAGSTGSTLLLSKPFLESNYLLSRTHFFPSFWHNTPPMGKDLLIHEVSSLNNDAQ
jgi:hypothetical protein